jgi:2-keto-4-pentenoate hydratase
VHCFFPDRRFTSADAIAAGPLHRRIVIGTPVSVSDIDECVEKLRLFRISPFRDGELAATGAGANVLGSPVLAFAHLARALARGSHPQPVQIRRARHHWHLD